MEKLHRIAAVTSLALVISAGFCGASASTISVGAWTPAFQGIDRNTSTIDGSVAYAVRIDLAAPGIAFTTTPKSGPLDTTGQQTSQFVIASGVKVGINADFFDPCCTAAPEPKNLEGLAVSNGTLVSPDQVGFPALLLTSANVASIQASTTSTPLNLAGVANAVSGSNILVSNGVDVAPTASTSFNDANPRSAVGISQTGEFLYLVAVDGRQPGYSVGTSLVETADLLIALGAYNGLNLDGGGSTALALADDHGGAYDLNRPSGVTERFDGNNLGVFALPVPEPQTLPLLVIGCLCTMLAYRRAR